MSNENVYSKAGVTTYTCADPATLVNKHAPRSETVSYGPGYPALTAPVCHVCGSAMVRDNSTSDPTADQITVQAAIDAGILPKPVLP